MATPQAPIGSRFGAASTAADVIAGRDLTGKTAVVTGGYSGIGAETVRAGGIVTDLIRHMSQAEIDASKVIDETGKPIIDPEHNKKTPQQGVLPARGVRRVLNLTAWAASIAKTGTSPARFLVTTAQNYMVRPRD